MESVVLWQGLTLLGIASWVVGSSYFKVTSTIRSWVQPWVSRRVVSETTHILMIQKCQCKSLDALFSVLSCVVSVPFYTAFLPLLFWSGHGKLARQMTLLMAFCDYLGNCVKDVVSAPRPSCPPVRRITTTRDEEENAMEYGLPSSHTLNTVCLSGIMTLALLCFLYIVRDAIIRHPRYLLHYVLSFLQISDPSIILASFALAFLFVGLVGLGRIYLGMHSVIDVIGGLVMGLGILTFWLQIHEHVDAFVVSGQNVTYFWSGLSFLLLFAYPTPEFPTPSFEFHTAFDGVAFGIVSGVQQTYSLFHHPAVPTIFTPQLTLPTFLGRMLVGIPTILVVKFCSKALAKRILPVVSNMLSMPIRSTGYIPMLKEPAAPALKKDDDIKQNPRDMQKLFFYSNQQSFDVDTGIRFLQYAGLAWSVVDLVPSLFSYLGL